MRRMLKMVSLCLVFILFLCPSLAYAAPYEGYTYDEWNRAIPAQNGYLPDKMICGDDMGAGRLKNPQDMFVAPDGNLYLLDSGNNRLLVLDQQFKVIRKYDALIDAQGQPTALADPKGVYVDTAGKIYIADTGNNRVLVCDQTGKILVTIGKPEADIYPQHNDFRPTRVLADGTGNIYVIVAGLFQGAVIFDQEGKFTGFYGSNRVELSAKVLKDLFWKKIMSKEQKDNMERYVPVEYTSFDVDAENFIYTCTARTQSGADEIRKLNPMGDNIFKTRYYGDLELFFYKGEAFDTSFVDIAVDDNDFIYGLDATRGRVFQYDKEANLVFIFGGKGDQLGLFQQPAAVEHRGNKILVLDAQKGNITIFSPTQFGENVLHAIQLYNEGMYEEALQPWKEVLKMNASYSLAYISIGKAYFNMDRYKDAQLYFRMGADRINESKAFREHRTWVVRQNFGWFASTFFAGILILYIIMKRKQWRAGFRSLVK